MTGTPRRDSSVTMTVPGMAARGGAAHAFVRAGGPSLDALLLYLYPIYIYFLPILYFIGRGPKRFFQECPTVRTLNPHCQDIVRSGQIYDLGNSGRKASGSDVKTLAMRVRMCIADVLTRLVCALLNLV